MVLCYSRVRSLSIQHPLSIHLSPGASWCLPLAWHPAAGPQAQPLPLRLPNLWPTSAFMLTEATCSLFTQKTPLGISFFPSTFYYEVFKYIAELKEFTMCTHIPTTYINHFRGSTLAFSHIYPLIHPSIHPLIHSFVFWMYFKINCRHWCTCP